MWMLSSEWWCWVNVYVVWVMIFCESLYSGNFLNVDIVWSLMLCAIWSVLCLVLQGDNRSLGKQWRYRVSVVLWQRDLHPKRRQRHHPSLQQPWGTGLQLWVRILLLLLLRCWMWLGHSWVEHSDSTWVRVKQHHSPSGPLQHILILFLTTINRTFIPLKFNI